MTTAAELRQAVLDESATAAPWHRALDGGGLPLNVNGPSGLPSGQVARTYSAADAALIVALRNSASALLRVLDEAHKLANRPLGALDVDDLRAALAAAGMPCDDWEGGHDG